VLKLLGDPAGEGLLTHRSGGHPDHGVDSVVLVSGRQVRPFRSANPVMGWGLRQNLGLDADHARCDTREIAEAAVPRASVTGQV
jgi:hypothetical protein